MRNSSSQIHAQGEKKRVKTVKNKDQRSSQDGRIRGRVVGQRDIKKEEEGEAKMRNTVNCTDNAISH